MSGRGPDTPAIEGGTPVHAGEPVPFFRTVLSDADIAAATAALRSGWLTLGPRVGEFEHAFAARVGSPHAIAMNSCTSALFAALRAFGVGPGDEVVVPSLTFASSVNTIRHCGATPVLCDVDADDACIDPVEVERLLGPRTRVIVGVDYAGQPCRVQELQDLARGRGIAFLEDAAHSFGAAIAGKPVGAWADATAFSFYATKCITTGEGGMLCSPHADFAETARLLGYHGMQRDTWKRYSARGSWHYEVTLPGYKFNMTDVQAALGLSQLGRDPELRAARGRVVQAYSQAFADVEALVLPRQRTGVTHAWHLYVVQLRPGRWRIDRDRFTAALREEGIVPSVHFIPYHLHPVGRDLELRRPLPRTEAFAAQCVSLPLFPAMSGRDVEDVITAVRKLTKFYAA